MPRVLLRHIPALDRMLFDGVARSRTPGLDWVMPRLTRLGDNSRLWLAVALALAGVGGRRGKRAAARGVVAIAATSLLVNQGVKRVVRRPRPSLRLVPSVRRLPTQPLTTSFPSGHAASAAAFTAGVGTELPKTVPVVGCLAGAVAYSRIYVGVHYPFDAAVGAAIGAGVAMATRRVWPAEPHRMQRLQHGGERCRLRPNADGAGLAMLVNPGAGSELAGAPVEDVRRRLPRAQIVEVGDDLEQAAARVAETASVLGVFGGDGSALGAARAALRAGRPLLVLPGGTLNHLARDLGVDSADDALAAFQRGEAVKVDVAAVDEHPFLNSTSFGANTQIVDAREQRKEKLGRWLAHVLAFLEVLHRAEPMPLLIDGHERRIWMGFVGNCRHEPRGFAPSWRPRLDDGMLDIRLIEGSRRWSRMRVLLAVLTGRLEHSTAYLQWDSSAVEIRSPDKPVRVTLDGDPFDPPGSFRITKLTQRLTIYTPAR